MFIVSIRDSKALIENRDTGREVAGLEVSKNYTFPENSGRENRKFISYEYIDAQIEFDKMQNIDNGFNGDLYDRLDA